ncbi:MAG: hypothetical protein ACYDB6_02935 [Candidatus Limnocylindrales bacterium]
MDDEPTDQERDAAVHAGHGMVREGWFSGLPCDVHPHGGCPITVLFCPACGIACAYHEGHLLPVYLRLPARAGAAS